MALPSISIISSHPNWTIGKYPKTYLSNFAITVPDGIEVGIEQHPVLRVRWC